MNPLLFCLALVAMIPFAQAQEVKNNAPIEITATQTLEWRENDKQYVATGNARAVQEAVSVESDELIADYRDGNGGATDIYKMTAVNNVVLKNEDTTATGDKAVYNVDQGYAVLTGANLKLVSPDQTVTAQQKMEYWTQERKAQAVGDAVVVRGTDTIKGDTIIAYFEEESAGSQGSQIKRMEAIGHVTIITPEETLTGDKAVYRAATNKAEMTGNVVIKRGKNILEGARAETDLTTKISRIFGSTDKTTSGRVRGVFYPGSKKDTN